MAHVVTIVVQAARVAIGHAALAHHASAQTANRCRHAAHGLNLLAHAARAQNLRLAAVIALHVHHASLVNVSQWVQMPTATAQMANHGIPPGWRNAKLSVKRNVRNVVQAQPLPPLAKQPQPPRLLLQPHLRLKLTTPN